jgi:hypothetical protein
VKLILVVTESEALPAFERTLVTQETGFTVLPGALGYGRTGLRGGDRVHPGSSSLLFTVVPEETADATLANLREARDAAGARATTRLFVTAMTAADEA